MILLLFYPSGTKLDSIFVNSCLSSILLLSNHFHSFYNTIFSGEDFFKDKYFFRNISMLFIFLKPSFIISFISLHLRIPDTLSASSYHSDASPGVSDMTG